jgi:DNA replication and repair protein RecF
MFLHQLSLQNFRSFKQKKLNFSDNTTLIVGPNASGKTNILEAIYLLATGKSFRATKETEMINYGKELAIVKGASTEKLEIILTTGEVQGKRTARKLYKVNEVGKRWRDFVGHLKCVLFRPENIEIILGSPSIRRDYLDSVLEQVDSEYRRCSLSYKKGLRQRNKLLDRIRDGEAQRSQLEFWNRLLIKNGELISQKREELIEFFNGELSHGSMNLVIDYDRSVISQPRLEKYAQAEIAIGATLIGPHRDDVKVKSQKSKVKNGRDLALFGSRGEQRMAILALKLAELEFIDQKTEERPVLLLDDIFSELDKKHRSQILKIIPKQQTVLTTTDIDLIEKKLRAKIELIEIKKEA